MFREGTIPKKKVAINVLLAEGGMGDILCYLVTANYIVKELTYIDPYIWVPDYLLEFAKNVLPENTKVYNYTTASKRYNNKLIGISTNWSGQHTPMRIHPIDFANHVLIDSDLPIEKKNYLKFDDSKVDISKFELPKKYVTISVGSTANTKELPTTTLNQIVDYVIEKGYTPVFIGKSLTLPGAGEEMKAKIADIDYTRGINLVDKTSIIESTAIIARAKAFVGMEGGLTHLAGFTDVKIVAGYSFVDPDIMMPIRNNKIGYNVFPVVPEESLGCRYCQSNMSLMYEHNFKTCFYKDYVCLKQLTIEKWKEQINNALKENNEPR